MKEFKGTKGKWENLNNQFIRCDYIGSSFKICEVVKDMPYPASRQMGEANAKLIAAAPDLLEAALEVIKIWNEDGDCGEIQMKTPIAWTRAVRKAEKAIDKALK